MAGKGFMMNDGIGDVISIAGLSKNAGKTTLLNRLIRDYKGTLALTSIGYDGESVDAVTDTPKPNVFVRRGTIIYTAESVVRESDITREIVGVTDIRTALGRVVAVRALSDGIVTLAGPAAGEDLIELTEDFRRLGAERMLIDGALSRRVFATIGKSKEFMYCIGASYSPDMEKTVRDGAFCVKLMTTGVRPENSPREVFVVEGILTDAMVEEIVRERKRVDFVAEDAGKLLISEKSYDAIIRTGCGLFVRYPAKCDLVAVNPYSAYGHSYDRPTFFRKVRSVISQNIPVIDCFQA